MHLNFLNFLGHVSMSSAIELLDYLGDETSYVAWKTVLNRMKTLYLSVCHNKKDLEAAFSVSA